MQCQNKNYKKTSNHTNGDAAQEINLIKNRDGDAR